MGVRNASESRAGPQEDNLGPADEQEMQYLTRAANLAAYMDRLGRAMVDFSPHLQNQVRFHN